MSYQSTKIKAKYRVVGVMSGTSLDGLDLALVDFSVKNGFWSFETIQTCTVQYPNWITQQLANATQLTAATLVELDKQLGNFIGEAIGQSFKMISEIDFIASHGHTVFHQPQKGISLQIGNARSIHKSTQLPVISDFRSLDVALGGNGAPLVPIGDQLLFSQYDCFLNLGGIANCTVYSGEHVLAYDIMPFNMVLNYLSKNLGLSFDRDGIISRSGKIVPRLLDQLSRISFYEKTPPKSLGFEDFEKLWLPILSERAIPFEDMMHTYSVHSALTISKELNKKASADSKLLVSGGGAYHKFFIELLRKEFRGQVIIPDPEIVEFKEAIIFGLLGVLRHLNEMNCLSSVTGATRDSSCGLLTGF